MKQFMATVATTNLLLFSSQGFAQNSENPIVNESVPITYYVLSDNNVIGSNQAPVVSFLTPVENQGFTVGDPLVIEVNASDSDGTVAKVDLRIGSEVVAVPSDYQAPYQWSSAEYAALNLPAGTHALSVTATDNFGRESVVTHSIIVEALNVAPTGSFVTPQANQRFTEGDSVAVEVDASDVDGGIASVELFVDGTALRTELNAPYNWNTAANPTEDGGVLNTLAARTSSYELKAVMTDSAGATTEVVRTIYIDAVVVDSDGDGVIDAEDAFPNDASETKDTDNDGVGDNADAFPNDPTRSEAESVTINLDFGLNGSPAGWNAITHVTNSLNLLDNNGDASEVLYTVSDTFDGIATINAQPSAEPYPFDVIKDAISSQGDNATASFTLSGLQPNQNYTIDFFTAHDTANDNRQATYRVQGQTEQTILANPSDRPTEPTSITLASNADGELVVNVAKGEDNNNSIGKHYLAAMSIRSVSTIVNPPPVDGITECNDGIDNDGDGLKDWQFDLGCWGAGDGTETAGTREQENGWTTFDKSDDSIIYYVSSSDGDDSNDGLNPETALATPSAAWDKLRDNSADIILLKRGDVWRDEIIVTRRKSVAPNSNQRVSGRSPSERIVVSSYGDSMERPRIETNETAVDIDKDSTNLAFTGFELYAYGKSPESPNLEVQSKLKTGMRFARAENYGQLKDILVEDVLITYGELEVLGVANFQARRNVFHKAYQFGTCANFKDQSGNLIKNEDGTLKQNPSGPNGVPIISGMFVGPIKSFGVGGQTPNLLIEENVFDNNGWNGEDFPIDRSKPLDSALTKAKDAFEGACATNRNHGLYLNDATGAIIRNNLFTRSSYSGVKVSGTSFGGIDDLLIENNLFAEGDNGIQMSGNNAALRDEDNKVIDTYIHSISHQNSVVKDNVFTDIGRYNKRDTKLSWGVTINSNDNTLYQSNLFVNPPAFQTGDANVHVFNFRRDNEFNNNVTLENNIVHDYLRAATFFEQSERSNINLIGNTFHNENYIGTDVDGQLLIRYERGDLTDLNLSGNRFYSKGFETDPMAWFRQNNVNQNLDEWNANFQNSDTQISTYSPIDSGRNLDSYAVTLGIGNTLKDFAEEAVQQSRFNWRSEYEAKAVNDYIREGYAE